MPDIESATTTPPREVRFSKSAKNQKDAPESSSSPGLQTVGSDTTATGLTINHSFSNNTSGTSRTAAGTLLGMSKPMAAMVGLALLGTTGAGIWGWLQVPGLNKQIKELETQVDRLEGQVTRLEGEVDRLESQVNRLEGENNRYALLNGEFNQTLLDLQNVNSELENQVGSLKMEVGRLGGEVDELEQENDRYEQINGVLNTTVLNLKDANQELRTIVAELDDSVDDLNTTVLDLRNANKELQQENTRYADLNAQLETISSYLNETASNLDESYEQLATQLAEQITGNRALVLQSLQVGYTQQISFWDCSFRDIFRGEPFINNEDLLIGGALPDVLEYVEERVLSEFCINSTDFEVYLDRRYGLEFVSVNQLYQGVAAYATATLDYYFPDEGEDGLTQEDWVNADYTCEGLTKFAFAR